MKVQVFETEICKLKTFTRLNFALFLTHFCFSAMKCEVFQFFLVLLEVSIIGGMIAGGQNTSEFLSMCDRLIFVNI